MTIRQPDGSKGLLARGVFGESVKRELADGKMTLEVQKAIQLKDQVRRTAQQLSIIRLTRLAT